MTLTIRKAGASDDKALALVGAATFLDGFANMIPGPDLIAHCRTQHSEAVYASYLSAPTPETAAWLAEHPETGAPVGYCVTCPPELPGDIQPGDVEIKRIYILAQFQGGGGAQSMMQAALNHARNLKAKTLWLGTYEGNDRAVAFYRRNGFETVGTRQFQVGDQVFDDVVMARPVAD